MLNGRIISITSIIGVSFFLYGIHRGGFYIFKGESLRKLIIITNYGIPVYSYDFRSLKDGQTISDKISSEILFSGAMSSISTLLSEFTGKDKKVEEILLSDLVIMINGFVENYSIILLVDHSSKFYRTAIERFTEMTIDLVNGLKKGMVFNNNEIKIANKFIEQAFGFQNEDDN